MLKSLKRNEKCKENREESSELCPTQRGSFFKTFLKFIIKIIKSYIIMSLRIKIIHDNDKSRLNNEKCIESYEK